MFVSRAKYLSRICTLNMTCCIWCTRMSAVQLLSLLQSMYSVNVLQKKHFSSPLSVSWTEIWRILWLGEHSRTFMFLNHLHTTMPYGRDCIVLLKDATAIREDLSYRYPHYLNWYCGIGQSNFHINDLTQCFLAECCPNHITTSTSLLCFILVPSSSTE